MHVVIYNDSSHLDNPKAVNKLLIDGSKRGILADTQGLKNIIEISDGSFKYAKLEQRIGHNHKSFGFEKNNFFFEPFNEKLERFVESGISEELIRRAAKYSEEIKSEDGPVVLTFEHLGVGFKIIMFFLLISFVVFCFEFVPTFYRSIFDR